MFRKEIETNETRKSGTAKKAIVCSSVACAGLAGCLAYGVLNNRHASKKAAERIGLLQRAIEDDTTILGAAEKTNALSTLWDIRTRLLEGTISGRRAFDMATNLGRSYGIIEDADKQKGEITWDGN